MERITITIEDELLGTLDALCARRGYSSRSEAIRDLLRQARLGEATGEAEHTTGYAALTYVYDHHTRDLAKRLTSTQHDHHDLSVATLHVHLNHEECLEIAVLKGDIAAMRDFADSVTTQRGVRYGQLHILPAESAEDGDHPHDHHHPHDRSGAR